MAEEAKKDNEIEKQDSPPKKKSIMLLVILGCSIVVIGIGGYFGWTMFAKKKADENNDKAKISETASKNQHEEVRSVFPLESFIVNLMDNTGSGRRYLKVTMELEAVGGAEKNKLEGSKTRIKDTILMHLSSRSFEEVNSVEGKIGLKQALLSQINQMMGENIVSRIYFTEFVVQ